MLVCVCEQAARRLTISGAEGNNARRINGTYVPVDEGRGVAYRQAEDPDMWLEWHAPDKKWIVRAARRRGTDRGWAYLLCDPPRLPTDPRGAKWQVAINGMYVEQAAVKCVTR
jgi:hypothetical protein